MIAVVGNETYAMAKNMNIKRLRTDVLGKNRRLV